LMGKLVSILQRRSPVVHVLGPDQTVAEAVTVMAEKHIGVVPILEGRRLVGIFSERDLLRRVVAKGISLEKTTLREVMTPDPVTVGPDEDRQSAIQKMQAAGCRHLPIMVNEHVVDMLSTRDLLFVELEERDQEIAALRGYIHGDY
jgi:CBS domain-containing protein